MRPRQVIITLETLFASHTGSLRRNESELLPRDNQTVREVYQQWLLLLLDLGYLPLDDIKREWGRMVPSMMGQDVLTVLNASAECLQIVYRQFPEGTKGFKALCSRISPNLFSILKEDVEKTINLDDVVAAKRLIQFFAYPTRLSLHQVDLMAECLNDYMAVEEAFPTYLPEGIIGSLNAIMRRWLKGLSLADLSYRHGNGSTAGSLLNLEDKYRALGTDPLLSYVYKDSFLPPDEIWESNIRCKMERISHTTFVPKSYKTFRTISMEPASLMFIQQGIWRRLDQYVQYHKYLVRRIGFHDQDRNKALAAEGALCRNYATIDLSAASDSVSWRLVKKVFKGTPLLKHLIATRSRATLLPDGRLVQLKKFAPMGSAMCFPVETLIFAACCEYVTREHGFYGDFSVFGDDIIVPTECSADMFYVLDILGFTVNKSKSFFEEDCWFRESCGGEYCDGYDVTPLRVSRKYYSLLDDVSVTGLIETANGAYEKGFHYLRAFFVKKLKDRPGFIPLFSQISLHGPSYSNYHTNRRWNPDLHRIECRVSGTRAKRAESNSDIAYFHWLVSNFDDKLSSDTTPWVEFCPIPSWDDEALILGTGKITVSSEKSWAEKPYEKGDDSFITYFHPEYSTEWILDQSESLENSV